MNKKLIIAALLIAVIAIGSASAFSFVDYADGIKDSSIFINVGVGYGFFTGLKIPPIQISVDYHLPIGIPLSVGAFFAFAAYEYSTWAWNYDGIYLAFGGRAAWHIDLGVKNLDLYAGVALGYMLDSWTRSWPGWTDYKDSLGYFYWGGFVGVKYFFTNNIGIYGEFGYSALTVAQIGLAIKF